MRRHDDEDTTRRHGQAPLRGAELVRQLTLPRDCHKPDSEEHRAVFRAAVTDFEAGRDGQRLVRPGFAIEDIPAPRRLAPHAAAIAATVEQDGEEIAWGRLILLYDPQPQPGWVGPYRLVAYVRADLEPEIVTDPLLCQVCWSWLTEALDARTPGYAAASGTVSRVITEAFGGKQDELSTSMCELRASWSPADGTHPPLGGVDAGWDTAADVARLDLAAHVTAWCDALAAAAGLPPAPEVAALPVVDPADGAAPPRPPGRRR